jgi:hypothetical protein
VPYQSNSRMAHLSPMVKRCNLLSSIPISSSTLPSIYVTDVILQPLPARCRHFAVLANQIFLNPPIYPDPQRYPLGATMPLQLTFLQMGVKRPTSIATVCYRLVNISELMGNCAVLYATLHATEWRPASPFPLTSGDFTHFCGYRRSTKCQEW